jgi:hypothetical protein
MNSYERLRRFASSRSPSVNHRIAFATAIACVAGAFALSQFPRGRPHSDFGMVWYGARVLLRHVDPYLVVGPSRPFDYEWPLIYPGTALVAVIPFTILTEEWATKVFVGLSTWLLAFGLTRDGWYRVPLFTTTAFIVSAQLGQWSILFTAALFLPQLLFFSAAKPQAAMAILAATKDRRGILAAVVGGLVLLTISLLMSPHWIASWVDAVSNATHMEPPIIRMAGPLVLIALLRWRRPETWLLLTLAASPQSWGWYGTLPIFTVPRNFGESVFLAATALIGVWYADNVLNPTSLDGLVAAVGTVIVVSIYLPAVFLILRRKNEGPSPAWLTWRSRPVAGKEASSLPAAHSQQ